MISNADEIEAHVLGVGSAASGYEDVRAREDSPVGEMDFYVCAGEAFDAADGDVGNDVDAFVVEELLNGFGDVGVFAVGEGGVALDNGDARAEAAHGLGKLKADVAAANDEEMFGDDVEFEGFDVGERMGFMQAGDGIDGGAGAGIDEDLFGSEGEGAAGVEVDLDGFGADEFAKAHCKLCAVLFEVVEVDLGESFDHLSFVGANGGHVDVPFTVNHAELRAALEVRGDLGAVDNVFAGQAGHVGTGSADGILLDGDDAATMRG